MPKERVRNRSRTPVAAISVAGFLALLGYEAARMHDGGDPGLARAKQKAPAIKSQPSASSSTQGSTQGDSQASSQDYYSPPRSDAPSTGSS